MVGERRILCVVYAYVIVYRVGGQDAVLVDVEERRVVCSKGGDS